MRLGGAEVIKPPSREPDREPRATNVKLPGQEAGWRRGRGLCTDAGGGRGDPSDGGLAEKWRADLHRTSSENLCTLSLGIIGSEERARVRVRGLACRKFGLRERARMRMCGKLAQPQRE